MKKVISFSFIFILLSSTNLIAQVGNLAAHNEVKDSIIARINRNDFRAVYQLADTTSFNTPEQNITRMLMNNKRSFGQIINSAFVADSACGGCNSKRGNYYLVNFQLHTYLMVLDVTPEKKFTSFGLLNYNFPERTTTSEIRTNNPLQTALDLSIDSAVRDYFRNPNAVGLSIGIIRNGSHYSYHYGETTKGNNQLPTNKTLYEFGSITKTFTSTILANAVLENRLNLKDDIRKYLHQQYPNFEFKGTPITLQDLSSHTSRIPSIPFDFYTNQYFDPLQPWNNYSTEMFWQSLHHVKIDTVPGSKEQYSNMGVAILGHILENVYKLSFDDLVKKYITDPFNMPNTGANLSMEKRKQLASKYSTNGNEVPYWFSPAFTAAGVGMLTNLDDLFNYADQQIAETNLAIKLTHQHTVNNSGLGWGIGNRGTIYRKYEHSGGTNGFSTHLRVFPEVKGALIILANNNVNFNNLIRRLSPLVIQ